MLITCYDFIVTLAISKIQVAGLSRHGKVPKKDISVPGSCPT